jgi:hypothetical protein
MAILHTIRVYKNGSYFHTYILNRINAKTATNLHNFGLEKQKFILN